MRNKKILIIEYKTGSTGKLDGELKSLRYTPRKTSFRLEDTLEVAKEFEPNIIIADMSVHADKNIIAKASLIQEQMSIPVIYYTEAINSRTLYQTMKTDHYGYIYTPYDESTLQTTIELALHKHKNDMSIKESEYKYKELFNSMTSGVAIYELQDADSKYVLADMNRAAEIILKRNRDELLKKPLMEIFSKATEFGLLDTIKRVRQTSEPAAIKAHYYEDGIFKAWFNSYIYMLPTGEFVHIFHDITEQMEAEQQLISKQKELEVLNIQLAKAVVEETDKRKKNEQVLFEQSRFLSMGKMISAIEHQWRQPLSALGINIEDLEDAHMANELDSDYIHDLTRDSMALIKTISKTMEDLKSFFRTSHAEEDFSIPQILSEVHGLILARLFNSDISFHMVLTTSDASSEVTDNDVPNFIASMKDFKTRGVPAEFKQVALNVLNNAIDAILEKKSREQGHVQGHISLELDKRDDHVNIYIRDNGIGISRENIARVFEPYYTTKQDSTGIGLYLSKIIIEEHMDGRLSASPLPSGAIFTITLPLK
jgi:signal transduction histidine kinase/AmiR/NasT family two-component response regulator